MMLLVCKNSVLALLLLHVFLLHGSAAAAGLARSHRRDILPGTKGCDVFSGSWVRDDGSTTATAAYTGFRCPVIDPQFNCQLYGRPDSDYLRYRWKPASCELPRYVRTGEHRTAMTHVSCLNYPGPLRGGGLYVGLTAWTF
jgi:hypothetical protein